MASSTGGSHMPARRIFFLPPTGWRVSRPDPAAGRAVGKSIAAIRGISSGSPHRAWEMKPAARANLRGGGRPRRQ